MGKGDKRRPAAVDSKTVQDRWDRTFGSRPVNGGQVDPDINPDEFDSKPEEPCESE